MKISGSNGVGSTATTRSTPRPASGGFSLSSASATKETVAAARASGPTGIGSIDALMALQEVGGPLERRRKAVKRAGRLLDLLDGVRADLLGGDMPASSLDNLLLAIREERTSTDDPRLEGLLNDIETRAAVEIAKLEVSARRQ